MPPWLNPSFIKKIHNATKRFLVRSRSCSLIHSLLRSLPACSHAKAVAAHYGRYARPSAPPAPKRSERQACERASDGGGEGGREGGREPRRDEVSRGRVMPCFLGSIPRNSLYERERHWMSHVQMLLRKKRDSRRKTHAASDLIPSLACMTRARVPTERATGCCCCAGAAAPLS